HGNFRGAKHRPRLIPCRPRRAMAFRGQCSSAHPLSRTRLPTLVAARHVTRLPPPPRHRIMAKKPAATLPAFPPVPRQRMRRGGWSADRQRTFIELLAETGSVRAACRRMGVSEHHIYKLRRHPEGASFRKAWEAALDCGI